MTSLSAPIQTDYYKWQAFDRDDAMILDEYRESSCWHPKAPHPGEKHALACLGDVDRVRLFKLVPRALFPGAPATYEVRIPPGHRLVFARRRSFDYDQDTGEYRNARTVLVFGHELAGGGEREVRFINHVGDEVTAAAIGAKGAAL